MPAFKTLIFTILVPGTVTVLIPFGLHSWRVALPRPELGMFSLVGLVPIAGGVVLYLWCAGAFAFIGRGTPAPIDPPKTLVVRGPYRFVRNAMYVGVWSVLIGEAVFFESSILLLYAVLVLIVFNLFVRLYEEPTLRRQFGNSYDEYCRAVPRWIPKIWGNSAGDRDG